MSRLRRLVKADWVFQDTNIGDVTEQAMDSARWVAQNLGFNESDVSKYQHGSQIGIEIGDNQKYGFSVNITFYPPNEVSLISVPVMGKDGQLQALESRDQSMFESFLNKDSVFLDWLDQMEDM